MFRSWGVVMELRGEVWVGSVGTLVGTGCGGTIGWSAMVGGCCVIRVCWSVSGIVGEVVAGSEDTVGVGGNMLGA